MLLTVEILKQYKLLNTGDSFNYNISIEIELFYSNEKGLVIENQTEKPTRRTLLKLIKNLYKWNQNELD